MNADKACVQKALALLARYEEWTTARQVEFCRIAAPSFQEEQRARYFRHQFQQLKLEKVRIDKAGNVLGEIPGTAPARERGVVALTAHLDTVFPGAGSVEIRRENGRLYGPGVTDNGAGLAALLAVGRAVKESGCRGRETLLFVANVGEEGEGNLRGMRHLLADPRLRSKFRGILVLDGAGTEQVTVEGLGSRRFQVSVEGPGGHSWTDFGAANPIHALAAVVTRLASVPLPAEPRTTCSVGEFRAGTSVNSIPSSGGIKVDIRSGSDGEIRRLAAALDQIAQSAVEEENRRARRGRLTATVTEIGDRPAAALPPAARIIEVVREVDAFLGIHTRLEQSSTDANIPLAMGLEAVALGGGGQGGGTHSAAEWFDPSNRILGLKRILLAALILAGLVVLAGLVGE